MRSITLGNVGLVDGDDITLGGTRYSEASAMTDSAAMPPPELTKPVVTATVGTGMVTLEWTGNDAAMDYTVAAIQHDLASGFYWMPDITEMMHTVSNLESGVGYYFVVAACEDATCTTYLWSDIVSATPN